MQQLFDRLENGIVTKKRTVAAVLIVCAIVGLYLTSLISYLLFHALAELFSIVVACALCMIAWNARHFIKNQFLLFIGIGYFFIAFLDLLHTLAYKGMPIFTDYDYYANQLWIGARYLESITLLLAFNYLIRNKTVRPYVTAMAFFLVTFLLVSSIFWWKIFPPCFVEGQGLTPFKKNSEYVICTILALVGWLLYRHRSSFDSKIYPLLLGSLACTIVSELAFTVYISNYGFSNLIGHYFKIFSFYLIYLAIIETGIREPFTLLFRELDNANRQLRNEVATRTMAETELKRALDQVKTLSGIIPICSYCKKIRDDSGYWLQLEKYLHDHSAAELSHGICPDCYPKVVEEMEKNE